MGQMRDGGRIRHRRCLCAAAIGLGACAAPSVSTLRSTPQLEGAEPLRRLVVYADLEGPGVGHPASVEFEQSVVHRLGRCGVDARVVSADRMDPTPPASRVEAALAAFEAHAVMVVQAAGGEINRADNRLNVKLELADVRRPRPSWLADGSAYFSSSDPDGGDGAAFAMLVVTRLRDDGVLTGCRRDEAYPGCLEDRRRALKARERAVSAAARNAMAPVPQCDPSSRGGG
jgi:hypothetical protein